jgi:hypothetical protein
MAPKRKSGYSADDSFVVSDDKENGTANRQAKRSKKSGEKSSPHCSTASAVLQPQRDKEGDIYWEISKARRVTINDYRGKKMVSVREYYEKDGEWLPGKKGISMTLDQYNAFVSLLPNIENELRRSGTEDIHRPDYSIVDGAGGPVKHEAEDETEERDEDVQGGRGRANHEATSDEEE